MTRLTRALVIVGLLSASDAGALSIGSCTIVVERDGTLRVGAALDTLSSALPGASGGSVRITAMFGGLAPGTACDAGLPFNCARVDLVAPGVFDSAPPGNPDATFSARLTLESGSKPILVHETEHSAILLNGTYRFRTDLRAEKTSSIFGAGTYQATETITCE